MIDRTETGVQTCGTIVEVAHLQRQRKSWRDLNAPPIRLSIGRSAAKTTARTIDARERTPDFGRQSATAVASADEETAAQDTYGAARCRMTTSARSRGQIPRLLLGPREHPRKDDKGGDNSCNDYCVYDRHDITFRDDRIR